MVPPPGHGEGVTLSAMVELQTPGHGEGVTLSAMVELQIVGGGRMGEALLGGILAGRDPTSPGGPRVSVCEPLASRRDELSSTYGVDVTAEPVPCRDAIIAVKPHHVHDAVSALARAGVGRILSIAAGVTTASLQAAAGPDVVVVRAMPNTPALVGQGASAIAPGPTAGSGDLDWAEELLGTVGVVVRVAEVDLDAVTGLSGSGPAYVFLVAEALVEAGVLNGLSREVAGVLATQTLLGAATLLSSSDRDPAALRADVTSPGGTTAAGLQVLEDRGLRAAVLRCVTVATERSRELGAG